MSTNDPKPDASTEPSCHAHGHEAHQHASAHGSEPASGAPGASTAIYTCPMHPEIRQVGPGSCPICGMALEPVDAAVDEGDSEYRDMRRRFVWSAVLSLPILVLAMGDMVLPGAPVHRALGTAARWLELAFATPVVLWAAWPLLVRAWESVVRRKLNMFTLIGLGVSVAYVYSVLAVALPGAFPDGFRGEHGVAVYFEAAAVIVALVLLGQVLELRARSSTGAAIRALLDLSPKTTRRIEADGTEEDVPLEAVQAGDRLRVRPGEAIPVDGRVVEGRARSTSRW